MKKGPKSILIRLLIIVCCSAIAFGFLFYLYYAAEEAEIYKWEKLPSPTEKIATILYIRGFVSAIVRTEAGDLYECRHGDLACKPSEVSEKKQAEVPLGYQCDYRLDQQDDLDHPPHGKVIDGCVARAAGLSARIVLLEDNSLWYQSSAATAVPPEIVTIAGICLGSVIGLVVGLAWVIVIMIKARLSARRAD
jgi:hypothetical protein